MSLQNYDADADDAQGLSRTFPQFTEPDFSSHNAKFPTAKYQLKPMQDEILKLISSVYGSGTTPRLGLKNRLINGSFKVAQRGTSFTSTTTPANNDDTYLLDRWYMLTDGNDVFDVTQQLTDDEYEIRLDVETINKKGGIAQIIEYKDCQDIIAADGTVTFSFQAKVSSTTKLDNIKAAILSWSGTADTVTSDFVAAAGWGIEGTTFTPATSWTLENTPANLGVTTSYATYSVSAAIDTASTKNIAVFIWSDVTDTTAGDFIHIKRCQLELGTTATPFEFRPFQQELTLCQRYYTKSYAIDVTPGTASTLVGIAYIIGASTNTALQCHNFATWMRIAPAVALYSYLGTANKISGFISGADVGTTVSAIAPGNRSLGYVTDSGTGFADNEQYMAHFTADAEL